MNMYLSVAVVFLYGLFIGSFLNVVLVRYNTGRTMVTGRSMCFSCGKTLAWYELIPVASFLLQDGKCRACKSNVSWQYPLVELASGALFAMVVLFLPVARENVLELLYYLSVVSTLLVIAVYDLRHKIIPDLFAYLFAGLGLVHLVASAGVLEVFHGEALMALIAGPLFALPIAALWFFSDGRWIGLGDAKLALGIGWFLGLALGGSAMVLSFWIGAVVGLLLIGLARLRVRFMHGARVSLKSEIPFGPFLILATLIVLFTHLNVFALEMQWFL